MVLLTKTAKNGLKERNVDLKATKEIIGYI